VAKSRKCSIHQRQEDHEHHFSTAAPIIKKRNIKTNEEKEWKHQQFHPVQGG
jgi:hypothetical protein